MRSFFKCISILENTEAPTAGRLKVSHNVKFILLLNLEKLYYF